MNDIRITQYVDFIFSGVKPTAGALEQKEELAVNITERVKDYMRNDGMSFDAAFEAAKENIGDTDELTAPFEKLGAVEYDAQQNPISAETPPAEGAAKGKRDFIKGWGWQVTALSPFIYLLLGRFFGWWAWAWVIIPVSAIVGTKISFWQKTVALSPFIYVLLGFMFGWWAWGWIIIPVAGVMAGREHFN